MLYPDAQRPTVREAAPFYDQQIKPKLPPLGARSARHDVGTDPHFEWPAPDLELITHNVQISILLSL